MKSIIIPLGFALSTLFPLSASGVTLKNGKLMRSDFAPKMSAIEHYNAGVQAMEHKSWRTALKNFMIIGLHFSESQVAEDAFYFKAVCNYHLMEYDIANNLFTDYLNQSGRLRYFEDALSYQLAIAEKFREGARKHLFDSDKFPKWVTAREDSIAIYDQIISTVPNHELAAKALFGKAVLQQRIQEYKDAIESYQTLIKRFPKHSLSSDAYLAINEIYFEQSHTEFQNPDLLELANLNYKRYKEAFPRDEKLEKAKEFLALMEEIHARGLYDTGIFYERTKKKKASVIYYVTALEKFPNAPSSALCKERLSRLKTEVEELKVSDELLK